MGDVTDEGNSSALLDEAVRSFGGFDAVFANAGYGVERAFTSMSSEELRRMFEVHFFSSVELCREAAHRWLDAGRGGHLLICSSCLSKFTLAYYGVYSATQAVQVTQGHSADPSQVLTTLRHRELQEEFCSLRALWKSCCLRITAFDKRVGGQNKKRSEKHVP